MCTAIVFYFVDLLYLIILNRGRGRGRQKTQRYVQHPPARPVPLCILPPPPASPSAHLHPLSHPHLIVAFAFDALCQQQFNSIELNLTPLLECLSASAFASSSSSSSEPLLHFMSSCSPVASAGPCTSHGCAGHCHCPYV